jgi:hypothetical protein
VYEPIRQILLPVVNPNAGIQLAINAGIQLAIRDAPYSPASAALITKTRLVVVKIC